MMAKPKHGRCGNNHIAVPSSPDPHRPCPGPLPRSHKRPHALLAPSHPFPSPAILSALALIAASSSVVAGNPLPPLTSPPSFLCPFIERDTIHPPDRRSPIPSSSAPSPSPTPTPRHSRREVVADRYVQGSDSLWRKTDSWTLYGSTCCSGSTTTHSKTPMPSSSLTTFEFDTSMLPAGWDTATNISTTTESTIILALAIVLAGSICIFMIGCVLWRKRKKRTKDVERKLEYKLGADDDLPDIARERDTRGKMRMWAKATARWKSNIRQSARRRRKRQAPVVSPSSPFRRDSFTSEKLDSSRPQPDLSLDSSMPELPVVVHDPPRSASPPTYGASFVPGFSCPTSASNSTPSLDNSHAVQYSHAPSFVDEALPYVPPPDGHIATDDKARLAHLRGLASSPPILDAASASTSQSISAPQWHEVEDDLEELGVDLSQVPMSFHHIGLPPFFPPPPSKGDVPFGYLADHSPSYREESDILVSHLVPEPPGSSAGLSPSAPPADNLGLEPSAPSLDDEDDLFQDWNGTSSFTLGAPTFADLDFTSPHAAEPSVSSTVSSISRTPLPTIRESATRNGTLPRYHP